jgi:thiol:disulfide interchange protein
MKSFFLLLIFLSTLPLSHAEDMFNTNKSFSTSTINSFTSDSPTFLPVAQAYQASLHWQDDTLLIDWTIAEGYYLYRERFAAEASRNGKPLSLQSHFKTGKLKQDPYFGETEVYYHNTIIRLDELPIDGDFTLKITSQGCADAGLCYPPQDQYYLVNTVQHSISPTSASKSPVVTAPEADSSLWLILAFAALGGAILNLMPCVFPVLGLKVLSFANARSGSALNHGLFYSAGVIISFVAVAVVLILLQSSGQAIGWGFQLQTPWFVGLLASLFFVLSLNLLGLFEIGGSWMNLGGDLSRQSGYRGSFFTGVLATVVASPCTAPFMGTAVGFAASQTAALALLVFAFIGLGMALPVLLLTLYPTGLQKLPKPGQWMITFRQVLAFPLLATAIWLSWVVGRQTGADGMALTLVVWLLLGFAIWLANRGRIARYLAIIAAIMSIGLLIQGLSKPLPQLETHSGFDPAQIQILRESGQNVFLDVTADWCITCAANEALVLNTDTVREAFARHNVHYLIADWTRYDPAITALLADYKRNGIPLYVYFATDLNSPAIVLPQVLTQAMILQLLGDKP